MIRVAKVAAAVSLDDFSRALSIDGKPIAVTVSAVSPSPAAVRLT